MEIRLIAVFVLAAACALSGRMLAGSAKMRADRLARLREDLILLKEYTLTKLLPMSEALLKTDTVFLKEMGKMMKEIGTASPSEAYMRVRENAQTDEKALEYLKILFEAVGTLSGKAHEAEYEKCAESIYEEEKKLRREGEEKSKLYTSLGALLGLSVGIFLM